MVLLSPFFKRHEFACKCGCGLDTVDAALLYILERIRAKFNSPVRVNSACRCSHHNNAVGGKTHSYHLYGRAADITVDNIKPIDIYNYVDEMFKEDLGLLCYEDFVHIDTRTGEKFRMGKSNGR